MTPEQWEQKIAGRRDEILAFQSSPVWQLWIELADAQKEAHMHNATYGKTLEEREFARISVQALDKFKQIPFALVRKVEAISLDKAA
jgi:hypothetical protein